METTDHMDIMHAERSIEKHMDERVWILKPEVVCSCRAAPAKLRYMDRQTMARLPCQSFEHAYTYTENSNQLSKINWNIAVALFCHKNDCIFSRNMID